MHVNPRELHYIRSRILYLNILCISLLPETSAQVKPH